MVKELEYDAAEGRLVPRRRLALSWKALAAMVLVIIVVLASVGLIYTQPWSTLKVSVTNNSYSRQHVAIYVDGKQKTTFYMDARESGLEGRFDVKAGWHNVSIDIGYWYRNQSTDLWEYVDLDGNISFMDIHWFEVGPISTKNVWIGVS
jgi:hypothetical protein